MEEKSSRFVEVARAKDVRVNGLNAAKETIKATRQHFRIEILRTKKLKLIKDLKEETKELSMLFGKLYEYLPDHDILEIKKEKASKKKKTKAKTRSRKKQGKEDKAENELERLEKALSQIEQKLKGI